MRGVIVLAMGLGAFLAVSVWFAYESWTGVDDAGVDFAMTWHGWLALGLGVVLTAALGVGLMMLTFHSSRSGHDDSIDPDG